MDLPGGTALTLADLANLATFVATFIGIPVAVLTFLSEKRKERRQREADAYIQAGDRYVQYLTLCLQHPELDCFDLSVLEPQVRETRLSIQKLTLFTILISMLEAGFILYTDHRREVKERQWQGWHDYMIMWASRPDFRQAWPALGPQFDQKFVQEMERLIAATPMLAVSSAPQ
jgi:hypothetical protein